MKRTIILTLLLCMAVTASAQFGRSGPERQPFGRGAYRRGEFGGGWSPLNEPSLFAWYRSDQGIVKDGSDRVSRWDDKSGNVYNISQTNAANMLLWEANQINGYPALRIDSGVNDWLTCSCPNVSAPYMIFVVLKPNAISYGKRILSRHLYTRGTVTNAYLGSYIEWTTPVITTEFRVYTMLYKVNASTQWVNDGAGDIDSDCATIAGLGAITIGSTYETTEQFQIADMIVCSDELADGDRNNVINYLMERYGL